jgi:hypothetical protein
MATTTQETGRQIALVDIRVPDNVRELDPEHVKALAGSPGRVGARCRRYRRSVSPALRTGRARSRASGSPQDMRWPIVSLLERRVDEDVAAVGDAARVARARGHPNLRADRKRGGEPDAVEA